MESLLKGLSSSLFLRADDTSEDTAKLLMSGKFQEDLCQSPVFQSILPSPLPNDVLIMLLMTPPSTSALGFKSLIEIQKHF